MRSVDAFMLHIIERLLELQELDRQIIRRTTRMKRVRPERESLLVRASDSSRALESARQQARKLEARRKELELETESEQARIRKYSEQQLQTRKNEEYRALTNEITGCRQRISTMEDRQLELMEEADRAEEHIRQTEKEADEARQLADAEVARLDQHMSDLEEETADLRRRRTRLTGNLDPATLSRYERLLRNRGDQSLVGVDGGNCGGCHVKLPVQIVINCKEQKEIIFCPNCGRMLYFAEGMSTRTAE